MNTLLINISKTENNFLEKRRLNVDVREKNLLIS